MLRAVGVETKTKGYCGQIHLVKWTNFIPLELSALPIYPTGHVTARVHNYNNINNCLLHLLLNSHTFCVLWYKHTHHSHSFTTFILCNLYFNNMHFDLSFYKAYK